MYASLTSAEHFLLVGLLLGLERIHDVLARDGRRIHACIMQTDVKYNICT